MEKGDVGQGTGKGEIDTMLGKKESPPPIPYPWSPVPGFSSEGHLPEGNP